MRAAIIGTGGIARFHARMIRELGGEVVGACGRTLAPASAFGHSPAYDSVARLLTERRPDVVHICSPNHLHAAHAIACFEAGAHVFCEKPMADSAENCLRMVEARDRAGRIGAIAYTYRGYPLIALLRYRVAQARFGSLRRVGGCYLSQDVFAPDKYVWLFTPGTTGRSYALMDLGVHWLNLAEYVSGTPIVEVTAQFSTHQPRRIWRGGVGEGPRPPAPVASDGSVSVDFGLEDQADPLVRFAGGAAGAVTVTGVSAGHPNTVILSADGSHSGFEWNLQDPNIYAEDTTTGTIIHQRSPDELPPGLAWMAQTPAGHAEGYLDAFRNVVAQARAVMRGGTDEYPTFEDGLRGVRLIEAAVQSAAGRRPVATAA
jgi:predicted dehydrogenase